MWGYGRVRKTLIIPIVLVGRKNGDLRFCIDNRELNDVTRKDRFPLPRIDDSLDTLIGAKWFSTLELKSGCWQVDIEDDCGLDVPRAPAVHSHSLCPCNAPSTFVRLMENVLRGLTSHVSYTWMT
jgi:hypothetical protein